MEKRMTKYRPDKWAIMEVYNEDETFYKVIGSWLLDDSWRANSGIVSVSLVGDAYHMVGVTGSVYICDKYSEGMSPYVEGLVKSWLEQIAPDATKGFKIVDFFDMQELV